MIDTPASLLKGTLDVLILKTLSWGPAHGYAISRWIRTSSAEDLDVEEGALYPALRRLEARGWLDSSWTRTDTGREARVYVLTRPGRQALHSQVTAWRRYVTAMTRVLEGRPGAALG